MGNLTRDRKTILPSIQYPQLTPNVDLSSTGIDFGEISHLSSEYEEVKKDLQPILQQMREEFDAFNKQYAFYQSYLHEIFLRNVKLYLWSTIYYAEWL